MKHGSRSVSTARLSEQKEPTVMQFRRLLKQAERRKQQLRKTMFIASDDATDLVMREATRVNIEVRRVPERELLTLHRRGTPGVCRMVRMGTPISNPIKNPSWNCG